MILAASRIDERRREESVKLGELDLLDGDLRTGAVPDVMGWKRKRRGLGSFRMEFRV